MVVTKYTVNVCNGVTKKLREKTNNKDNKKNILFFQIIYKNVTLYNTCMVYYYPQTEAL